MKKISLIFFSILFVLYANGQVEIDSVSVTKSGNTISGYCREFITSGAVYSRSLFIVKGDTLHFNYYWKFITNSNQSSAYRDTNILGTIDTTKNYCAYRFNSLVDTNTVLQNFQNFTSFILRIDSIIPTNLCAPLSLNNFNSNNNFSFNSTTKSLLSENTSDIRLYNLSGQLIYTKKNSQGPCPLPNNLPIGIYIAVCNSKQGVERLKIWMD